MHIQPTDIVLEIGSGDNPNPRSDMLCDRFVTDNGERAGGFSILIDRPFVVCDGYHLPFFDQSFDYVICSHTLEHTADPNAFVKEIMRVGKAGYIEVPSALSERIFGWHIHHWFCSLENKTLVMRKKTEGERFGGFFHRLIASEIWFRRFFDKHRSQMYCSFEWSQRIAIKIEKQTVGAFVDRLDRKADRFLSQACRDWHQDTAYYLDWMWRRGKRKIQKEIRRTIWRIKILLIPDKIISDITSKLCCIECAEALYRSGDDLKCTYCGRSYTLDGVIPILL